MITSQHYNAYASMAKAQVNNKSTQSAQAVSFNGQGERSLMPYIVLAALTIGGSFVGIQSCSPDPKIKEQVTEFNNQNRSSKAEYKPFSKEIIISPNDIADPRGITAKINLNTNQIEIKCPDGSFITTEMPKLDPKLNLNQACENQD